MRNFLSVKTMLREPFKTLLTFLLLTLASFAVFSRVTEYAVTSREMARARACYQAVGSLDTGVPDTFGILYSQLNQAFDQAYGEERAVPPPTLTAEQIAAISALPQVTSTDVRYMTSGISDKYTRINSIGGAYGYKEPYAYNMRFVLECTFEEYINYHEYPSMTQDTKDRMIEEDRISGVTTWDTYFSSPKLLAGDPSKISNGWLIKVDVLDKLDRENTGTIMQYARGTASGASYCMIDNPFTIDFLKTLKKGSRYLLIGRGDITDFYPQTKFLYLGDLDSMPYCASFWELDGKPENYLETDEFAPVREIIEITNSDAYTFDMVYTGNMLSIPRFADGKMEIIDGRALTSEDEGSNVCVVSQLFIQTTYGLEIGDKITMGLGGKLLPQHSGYGAVAVTPDRYSPPVKTVELEIVGIYKDTDMQEERKAAQYWGYSPNTIFVPSSMLPVEVPGDHDIMPGEFSAIVGDVRTIDQFLAEAEPLADSLGVKLVFNGGNWENVKRNMAASTQASLLTTALFVFAGAVSLLLAAYLLVGRGRKAYAIMRALGAPVQVAGNALLLPLAVLSALAIPLGGAAGLAYTARSVVSAVGSISENVTAQYTPDTSLPVTAVILCLICEVVFLYLIALFMVTGLKRIQPLVLLQADSGTNRKKTPRRRIGDTTLHGPEAPVPNAMNLNMNLRAALASGPPVGSAGAFRHVSRYIARHIRRTGWKAPLALLLAFLMTGAMGLFTVTLLSYEALYNDTEIKCVITGISSTAANMALSSKLLKEQYYTGRKIVFCHGDEIEIYATMLFTNDISRILTDPVEYAAGYDESFLRENNQCVLGNGLADALGVNLGETITLLGKDRAIAIYMNGGEIFGDEMSQKIRDAGIPYTVVGIVSTLNTDIDMGVIAPALRSAQEVIGSYGRAIELSVGEFVLADNTKVDEARDYIETLVAQSYRTALTPVQYMIDTSDFENVKRTRDLLNLMFPIAVTVTAFIGLTTPFLIIVQSAREAAALRVLGTTKKRVRCMLALEQLFICVIGLALAAVGLAAYKPEPFIQAARTLALCSGLYLLGCTLAVIIASAVVTRRGVLELLKAKE